MNEGTRASDSTSSRYGISAPRTAPPSGARKMAPIPAAIPEATAIRASRASRSSSRARYEPKPDPICAVGPSRPPEPPEPMVIADATSLTSGIRARTWRGAWWKAAIAASVPWPSASGARRKTITPETSPPSPTTSGSAHGRSASVMGRPPSPTGVAGSNPASAPSRSWLASDSAQKKSSRAGTRDEPDDRAQDDPFAQIGGIAHPLPQGSQQGRLHQRNVSKASARRARSTSVAGSTSSRAGWRGRASGGSA